MKRVVFEFPDDNSAKEFLAWFSDGGGESSYFDGGGPISRFDYKRAFPAWGYDPQKHGPDLVVEAQKRAPKQAKS